LSPTGDEQDAIFRIDVGSGHGHAGVEVANHELDAIADEFVGHRHPLLGVGDVVADLNLDLLPQDSAGLVDVFGGLLHALGELSAEGGIGSGDRSCDGDLELRVHSASEQQRQGEGHGLQKDCSHINLLCEFDRLACGH
jgi:hypothetical protein